MRRSIRNLMLTTTAVFGLGGFAAIAAPATGGDPAPVQPMAHSQAVSTHHADGVEQRITELHAKLAITAAEQPQWDQFVQVMRDNATTMDATAKQRAQAMPTMTAAENMQSYASIAMEHAQDMQKMVPAFQALYSSMTDSQKRMADQVFRTDAHKAAQKHG